MKSDHNYPSLVLLKRSKNKLSNLYVVFSADPGFTWGGPTPKCYYFAIFFAENCMRMKEFGPHSGGALPWRPFRSATGFIFGHINWL